MIQQQGWRRNSEGEMDRERWLCVILWTPFIYTWNKRLELGYKRLSWWRLKWNWHFQFVPWHVCHGLFTHSSASPSLAILLSTHFFSNLSLSHSLSLFLPSTSLQTSSHINLGPTFSPLPPSHRTPTVKQGNMEQIPLSHIPNTSRETHVQHYTINMHSAHGTGSREGCQQRHQRLIV